MWSLPHTESKPTRSASCAVGSTSAGPANGTGYIMPSMHVGMWTPNLMGRMPPASGRGGERGTELGGDHVELLDGIAACDRQDDGRVEPRVEPGPEAPARVIRRASE